MCACIKMQHLIYTSDRYVGCIASLTYGIHNEARFKMQHSVLYNLYFYTHQAIFSLRETEDPGVHWWTFMRHFRWKISIQEKESKKRPFLENKTQVFALSHWNALVLYVCHTKFCGCTALTKLVQFVPTGKSLLSFLFWL